MRRETHGGHDGLMENIRHFTSFLVAAITRNSPLQTIHHSIRMCIHAFTHILRASPDFAVEYPVHFPHLEMH
jgi:hypothetical protein